MELSIRINVRYLAPPNSYIRDMLQLFRSSHWVQFIIRYITPQLQNIAPISSATLKNMKDRACFPTEKPNDACVICMESLSSCMTSAVSPSASSSSSSCCNSSDSAKCIILPCSHWFHMPCIFNWFEQHNTCPICRHRLPTDLTNVFSVRSINTTIILQQTQANMPTEELLNLSSSNQTIRAVVHARVRRDMARPSLSEANGLRIEGTVSRPIITNENQVHRVRRQSIIQVENTTNQAETNSADEENKLSVVTECTTPFPTVTSVDTKTQARLNASPSPIASRTREKRQRHSTSATVSSCKRKRLH